jgi:hypothetical protein
MLSAAVRIGSLLLQLRWARLQASAQQLLLLADVWDEGLCQMVKGFPILKWRVQVHSKSAASLPQWHLLLCWATWLDKFGGAADGAADVDVEDASLS